MVLQGGGAGFSPPFDAPLFGGLTGREVPANEGYTVQYKDVDALMSFFTIDNDDVADVLPVGIEPYSDPPQGLVWISRYPFSTNSEYKEHFSLIQVEDPDGEMAYYCPYIYVDVDVAQAAGRELLGAPKKQATIELDPTGSAILATLERPERKRLMTIAMQADEHVQDNPVLEAAMPDPIPILSLRHLPPIEGDDGITQLVKWYAQLDLHDDATGDQKAWMGPASVTYDSPSEIDPVHKLGVGKELLTMYAQLDMELGTLGVEEEWRV